MSLLVVLGAVTALAAAARSSWSPCGVSMLSSITPLAERGRGRRYAWTAAWFVLGALLGGLTLGAVTALAAVLVGVVDLSATEALAVAGVAALGTAAVDAGLLPPALPHHRRQVNELWLTRYRSWVYGIGFGWQIGAGLVTYIMTAAVYLTVVLAALTTSAAVALALGGLFGAARGLALLAGAGITSPERLRAFHRRADAGREPVRRAALGAQLLVALVASAAAWGPSWPTSAVAVSVAALVGVALRGRGLPGRRRRPRPPAVEADGTAASAAGSGVLVR